MSQKATPVLFSSPQRASLSGIVFLSTSNGQGGWLLTDSVELRRGNFSMIAEYPDENRPQNFLFENIEPGTYELWVSIPSETLSLKNCYDVGLPDRTWKLGRILSEGKTLLLEDMSYREAYFQAVNMQSSDLKTYEFYAVLEGVKIEFGVDNNIDAILVCKPS